MNGAPFSVPRLLLAIIIIGALLAPGQAAAVVSSGEPAALLVFPLITVDAGSGTDTSIDLTNADDGDVGVRCLYKNVQGSDPDTKFTPFLIRLMGNQPVVWRAGVGLAAVPGDGGSIPPVPAPFTGVLRCVAADATGAPVERNALFGSATVERAVAAPARAVDSARYAAIGHDAVPGQLNGDAQLVLGGDGAEYAACPASVELQSFFDGAALDLGSGAPLHRELSTTLALVTCAQGVAADAQSSVTFTATNEFGQRVTYIRSISEQLVTPLSRIDTDTPAQSIFNVAQQHSLAGTIEITPQNGSGVLVVALQTQIDPSDPTHRSSAALMPQLAGSRTDADVVDLALATPTTTPAATPTATSALPSCAGDCSGDGSVAINELIAGVGIALGNQPLTACPSFDVNGDGRVAINELIAAVNNALGTC